MWGIDPRASAVLPELAQCREILSCIFTGSAFDPEMNTKVPVEAGARPA